MAANATFPGEKMTTTPPSSSAYRYILLLLCAFFIILSGQAHAAYADNGDGTVTDTATGLIWMRCAMGQTWSGTTCTGTANTYTWEQAKALTANFAGQSDWRLPNVRELESTKDRSYNAPITFPRPEAYPNFWTGSADASLAGNAWQVFFSPYIVIAGHAFSYEKSNLFYVRLVRGSPATTLLSDARPDSDYIDNGDGTVTHKPTGLMWKLCSEGQTWTGTTCSGTASVYSMAAAASLTGNCASKSDWRLPNLDELGSLVDYTKTQPASNKLMFQGAVDFTSTYLWSGTCGEYGSYSPSCTYVTRVRFGDGSGQIKTYGYSANARLVRGASTFGLFPPDAPFVYLSTTSSEQVAVSLESSYTGLAIPEITSYTVTANPGGITATGSSSPITVSGLTNGTAYTFTATATNSQGTGPASAAPLTATPSTQSGLPYRNPYAVDILGSAVPGDGSATVTFKAPTETVGGGALATITSYTVTANPGVITATGSSSPITITGLTNGTRYSFEVTATNRFGTGSTISRTSAVQPTNLITNSDGTLSVTGSGLTWMRCPLGMTWSGTTCTGTPNTYTWNQAKVLTSNFAGLSDWRQPNVREVLDIYKTMRLTNETEFFSFLPTYEVSSTESYTGMWTSTTFAADHRGAWMFRDPYPYLYDPDKSLPLGVVRVRGELSAANADARPDADYTDNGDGTVTHKPTGLVWKRCSEGQTWTGTTCSGEPGKFTALQARGLTANYAGKSDWRLPTTEELMSLTDYTKSGPAINTFIFPGTPAIESNFYWSASVTDSGVNAYQDYVDFFHGWRAKSPVNDGAFLVRLVRVGQLPAAPTSALLNFTTGWNLVGNSNSATLDVATVFGDTSKVTTVWKWIPATSKWAFYAPSMSSAALAAYATSKGYDVLATINGGEGFWVNALTAITATLPTGAAVPSSAFATKLASGWNLLSIGESKTPRAFNNALSATPPTLPAVAWSNLTTLWAWNNAQSAWYFYAPSLDNTGGLEAYTASKNYLNFGTGVLAPGSGFWVNKP